MKKKILKTNFKNKCKNYHEQNIYFKRIVVIFQKKKKMVVAAHYYFFAFNGHYYRYGREFCDSAAYLHYFLKNNEIKYKKPFFRKF